MVDHIKVAIIGDHIPDLPSHIATMEALEHAANSLSVLLKTSWIPTQSYSNRSVENNLTSFHGVWGAPGDYLSTDGALNAIKHAREQGMPFIGT